MRIKVFLIIGLAAAIGGAAAVFLSLRDAGDSSAPEATQMVPDLTFQNYDGQNVKISDFRGTPLLINVWASWCPYCRSELLDFAAAKKEFAGRVEIIAIDRQETQEVAKKYSDELGLTGDLVFLLDPSDSFYKEIGGFSMPETIFVDAHGFVKDHRRGPMTREEMRRRIQDAFGI